MAAIVCDLCDTTFGRKDNFLRHYVKCHLAKFKRAATNEDMWAARDTAKWYIEHACLPPSLSAEEKAHVKPSEHNADFQCIQCDCTMKKVSAMKHFKTFHRDTITEDIADWVIIKDGAILRHGWLKTHLETYFECEGGSEGESAEGEHIRDSSPTPPWRRTRSAAHQEPPLVRSDDGGFYEEDGDADQPPPWVHSDGEDSDERHASARNPSDLGAIFDAIGKLQKAIAPEASIKTQKLTLKQSRLDWTPSDDSHSKFRIHWPFEDSAYDLEDFAASLSNAQLGEEAVISHVTAITRFADCFEVIDGSPLDLNAMIVSAWECNMIKRVFEMSLFHESRSWTKKIGISLDKYIAFQSLQFRTHSDMKSLNTLGVVREAFLLGTKKKHSTASTTAKEIKKARDADYIDKLPAPDVIKDAVKAAMLDLLVIINHFEAVRCDDVVMPPRVRQIVNVLLVGIIYCNGFAGRPQEWSHMQASEVKRQLEGGRHEYLETSKYKTVKHYGVLAKWLAPATRRILLLALDLPRTTSEDRDLLLKPSLDKQKKVQCSNQLNSFTVRYRGKDVPAMTPTLVRKWFHTKADTTKISEDVREKIMELLCRIDRHSVQVGKGVYVAKSAKDDAETSNTIFTLMMGEPVEFPTQDEIARHDKSFDEVIAKTSAEAGDTDGEGDEEECAAIESEESIEDADTADEVHPPPSKRMRSSREEHPVADAAGINVGLPSSSSNREERPVAKAALPPVAAKRESRGLGMRAARFTEDQKTWIMSKAIERKERDNVEPSRAWFKQLLEIGVRDGVLTNANTAEGLRNVWRAHWVPPGVD
jgi:hypothetical protein